jgi:acetyl esterase/lipase
MLTSTMRLHLCLVSLIAVALHAEPIGPVHLWPGQAPGEKGNIGAEYDTTTEKDNLAGGQRVARIINVTVPTLTVYQAPEDKRTGAAVLVFPGGGFHILAVDLEGTEICAWLNSIGVTGILVKYRVPAREGLPRYLPPLQDAQRAMGMVRARAKEWGIDPHRVGVLGFSAGAHLSAALSTNFEKRVYPVVDDADGLSCRPDFAVLIYPGGVVPEGSDQLSPELRAGPNVPPAFLAQTEDDPVRVENSLAYYAALKAAKVPVEMHLYPTGGHGYGLRPSKDAVATWPARAEEWLRQLGVLAR